MEEQSNPIVKRKNFKKLWLSGAALVAIAGIAIGGFAIWNSKQPKSLLPPAIAARATDFMPYFYFGEIPAGYSLDEASISFDGDILLMPLTKPGNPTIVLTEQALPDDLPDDLQKDGSQVSQTVGSTVITVVENRQLGSIITMEPPKTLLLLNAPATASKSDLIALLQGLRSAE